MPDTVWHKCSEQIQLGSADQNKSDTEASAVMRSRLEQRSRKECRDQFEGVSDTRNGGIV